MAIHTTLPIYKVAYDLLDVIIDLAKNMPRDFKILTSRNNQEYIPHITSHEVVGFGSLCVAVNYRKVFSNAVFLRLALSVMGGLSGEPQGSLVPHQSSNPFSSTHPFGRGWLVKPTMRRIAMQPNLLSASQQKTINRALRILERLYFREYKTPINSVLDIKNYFRLRLAKIEQEEFYAVWLDTQNFIISLEKISTGTLTHCQIYPREVVKRALTINAASVIFCHNHPSGNASPSEADITLTSNLKQILKTFDVTLLDHLIIGATVATSLAEIGVM